MGRGVEGPSGRVRMLGRMLRRWMSGPELALAFLLSGLLNAMQISSSLYLFYVYDRVLPTGDRAGLAVSTGLLVASFAVFALLDFLRARLLGRAGVSFVQDLERGPLFGLRPADVDRVRRFSAQGAPAALFDLTWLPVSLVGLSLVHPLLSLYALLGAVLISGIAIGSDVLIRANARELSDGKIAVASAAKAMRLVLQLGGIGFGAWLVAENRMSAGGLIAASVMMARAFAVLDGALVHWRSYLAIARTFAAGPYAAIRS